MIKKITVRFGAKFLSHLTIVGSVLLTVFEGCVCNIFYDVTFHIKKEKKERIVYFIPVAVILLLLVLNLFTGILFSIDENNIYTRGPYAFLSFAMQYLMFVVLGIRAILFKLSMRTVKHLKLRNSFILLGLLSFVFGFLQLIAGGKIALFCFGLTASIFVLFLRFQDDQITNDNLTGLNNRYSLDSYLSEKIKTYSEGVHAKKKLYLIMMDINFFKGINDKYGHVEGDNALKITASALKAVGGKHEGKLFLARFGGDEFSAVYEAMNEQMVIDLCDEIKDSLKEKSAGLEYTLEMGMGYAFYKGTSMLLSELYNVADMALYKDKEKLKKEENN